MLFLSIEFQASPQGESQDLQHGPGVALHVLLTSRSSDVITVTLTVIQTLFIIVLIPVVMQKSLLKEGAPRQQQKQLTHCQDSNKA